LKTKKRGSNKKKERRERERERERKSSIKKKKLYILAASMGTVYDSYDRKE
jgi:fructose/tagatose bisphosphate aldolase